MEFIVSTESTCDFTQNQIDELNLNVLDLNYYVGGVEHNLSNPLSTIEICKQLEAGISTKTSQPNETEIEEYLLNLLKSNKDILHISFSSQMSGTCNSFRRVAEKLNKNSHNKIYVVDSLCQSFGVGLLIKILFNETKSKNFTIEQAVNFVENLKLQITHYFVVDDLKYLAQGGRIPSSLAFVGNLLKLKPFLHVDKTGKIVQLSKTFGRKKAISMIIDKFKTHYNHFSNEVFISESACRIDAENLKDELLKINPDLIVTINELGPVIVSHSGPGTMALYFTANERI